MSDLTEDELRRMWREAGGDFETPDDDPRWMPRAAMDDHKLISFLSSFAARMRAEGIETAARWHDEQAAGHRNIASSTRENWTGQDIGEDDRRNNLRYARENDADAGRHDRHAKALRALADEPVGAR